MHLAGQRLICPMLPLIYKNMPAFLSREDVFQREEDTALTSTQKDKLLLKHFDIFIIKYKSPPKQRQNLS